MSVTRTKLPEVYVPDADELLEQLGIHRSVEERMAYVVSLLPDVRKVRTAFDNYEQRIRELESSKNQMAQELRTLRQKLGDLSPGERTAVDQRYDMLSKLKAARGKVPALRRQVVDALDEIEKTLGK